MLGVEFYKDPNADKKSKRGWVQESRRTKSELRKTEGKYKCKTKIHKIQSKGNQKPIRDNLEDDTTKDKKARQ